MFIIFIIFVFLNIILNLNDVMNSVYDSLFIWFYNVFPSIFIFYNISSYLINNKIFCYTSKIFKLLIKYDSSRSYCLLFINIFLGNPGTVNLINNAFENEEISYNDYIKLNDTTFFMNPLFILSFTNIYFYLIYLLCCFIYIKLYDVFYKVDITNNYMNKNNNFIFNFSMLTKSISSSINILLNVAGLITFFNVFKNTIIFIFDLFNINIFNIFISNIFLSFLEIASGLKVLEKYNNAILYMLLFSFQGVCILFQSYSFSNKKNISFKRYILSHLISSLSITLIFIILKFLFHI